MDFKKAAKRVSVLVIIVLAGYYIYTGVDKDSAPSGQPKDTLTYPSDVIGILDKCKITLGDGSVIKDLMNFSHSDYFYTENDGTDWVVYKTPNSGITTPNSHNTRSELGEVAEWTPLQGGKLNGTLKVMHVSTNGDPRVAASYSVVVGQIHGSEGHENEPIKIFYKKFPGHSKGSVFWNYEINPVGDNSGRWDFSTAIWGHDMSVVGVSESELPLEPEDGISLGEEFSYEINVFDGIMYLTFESEGHETKTFTKSLITSDFSKKSDTPEQILTLYASLGRDGIERPTAYAGESQYFKQGAYNQTNGDDPAKNMVWSSGSDTFDGDLAKQYAHGSYVEVWFRSAQIGPGTAPVQ